MMPELIALAKAWPGQLTFASSGIGASSHLAGEMLKFMAKIDITHVPYRGTSQALTDLMAGTVSMALDTLSILASLKQELGELDRVTGWVKALGFVKCAEGFDITPAAINGFSDLILALWGDAGRHARSAIGAGELPFGMPVEVEAVVALG